MKKRWLTSAALGALALVLANPGTSSAIIFGAGGANVLTGYGWGGYGFGYPGVYGPGYGTTYVPYGFAYSPGYRGVTVPRSVAEYPQVFTHSPQAPPRPSSEAGGADASATVQVEVPANAALWFDGVQTKQTGARRTFHTPPLERGHNYHYDVKARWEENGKPVERTRRVSVSAGARVTVDFNQPGR
jgi:uncharacterized protein (TIGR03000 family)